MKNYNKPETINEEKKFEEKQTFKENVKNVFKPVDKQEKIKEEIQKQKEKIQALENSIKYYFIDKSKFVNFRKEPDKNGIVIEILSNGTFIEPVIYNDTQEWTKVKYNNKVGYVMTKFIGVEDSAPEE